MIGSLLLALSAAAAAGDGDEVFYVDASLEFEDRLLSWQMIGGIGRNEPGARDLVLAMIRKDGTRELRLHNVSRAGVAPEPRVIVPIKEDIAVWGVANVRPEPGRELIFLTGSGAWSYSVTLEGYRGNVRTLARAPLLFDIPQAGSLPHWSYALPGGLPGTGFESVILPERDGLTLWSPTEAGDGTYEQAYVLAEGSSATPDDFVESLETTRRYRTASDRNGPFTNTEEKGEGTMLSAGHGYGAAAVLDVDGDGRRDVLALGKEHLTLYLSASRRPTRVEPLPAYMDPGKGRRRMMLADADGDGDVDLLVILQAELKEVGKSPARVLVLINDGSRLLPEKPTQVLKLEGTELRIQVTDVNGDGRGDLVVRKFEIPGLRSTITGMKFRFSHLVFFGEGRAFARSPAVKHVETYTEQNLQSAVGNYELKMDCSGDGVADLASVDLEGRITVRRILYKKGGMFRSASWKLEPAPWKVFDIHGELTSLRVLDLNGDGLGDLVSARENGLTLLLSRHRGGR